MRILTALLILCGALVVLALAQEPEDSGMPQEPGYMQPENPIYHDNSVPVIDTSALQELIDLQALEEMEIAQDVPPCQTCDGPVMKGGQTPCSELQKSMTKNHDNYMDLRPEFNRKANAVWNCAEKYTDASGMCDGVAADLADVDNEMHIMYQSWQHAHQQFVANGC